MPLGKLTTAIALMKTLVIGSLAPAQAGSRLNEKNIIKKLIFKKKTRKAPAQRPVIQKRRAQQPVFRRKKSTTTTRSVTRKPSRVFKGPVRTTKKYRAKRKKKTFKITVQKSRVKRRSLARRKKLRRILTAKRKTSTKRRKTTTRRAKRAIAFPAPAVEFVDNTSGKIRKPGATDTSRTKPRKTKWARTTPSRKVTRKKVTRNKKVWRKRSARPAVQYVEEYDEYERPTTAASTVKVATTRLERDQIKAIVDDEELPQIDIEIYFDYNSATIRPRSMPDVGVLGRALRNKQLAGSQFMIIGHTDATGGDAYNLRLSEERAQAVRNFLVNVFGLDGERFFPMGYGEEQLKLAHRPDHPQNRRVQIVNIGDSLQ